MFEMDAAMLAHTRQFIIYCKEPQLVPLLSKRVREVYSVKKQHYLLVHSKEEWSREREVTNIIPFSGGLWSLVLDYTGEQRLNIKEVKEIVYNTSAYCVQILFIKDFKVFKALQEDEKIKKMRKYTHFVWGNKYSNFDIEYICSEVYNVDIPKGVKEELKSTYLYDILNVLHLCERVQEGLRVRDKRDVIKAIGEGGNTIDRWIIGLLTTKVKTKKGWNASVKRQMKLLDDLLLKYKIEEIVNLGVYILGSFRMFKQTYVAGEYNRVLREYSKGVTEDVKQRLQKVVRYADILLDDLTLGELLEVEKQWGILKYAEDVEFKLRLYVLQLLGKGVEVHAN